MLLGSVRSGTKLYGIRVRYYPVFGFDGLHFHLSNWYNAVFWIQYEKNVDNTTMLLAVAEQCFF